MGPLGCTLGTYLCTYWHPPDPRDSGPPEVAEMALLRCRIWVMAPEITGFRGPETLDPDPQSGHPAGGTLGWTPQDHPMGPPEDPPEGSRDPP